MGLRLLHVKIKGGLSLLDLLYYAVKSLSIFSDRFFILFFYINAEFLPSGCGGAGERKPTGGCGHPPLRCAQTVCAEKRRGSASLTTRSECILVLCAGNCRVDALIDPRR